MTDYGEVLLVILLLLDLYMVSTHRLISCIKALVVQGVVLAALIFPLSGIGMNSSVPEIIDAVVSLMIILIIKGIFIPWMLFRFYRKMGSPREFEPFISLHLSQFVNGLLIGVAFWAASVLPWPGKTGKSVALGIGLATMLIGLFMTVNRKKALSQVFGYLVIESGLFVISWTILGQSSLLIDIGSLLDLLVAVMVLGVLATRMEKDWKEPSATAGGTPS